MTFCGNVCVEMSKWRDFAWKQTPTTPHVCPLGRGLPLAGWLDLLANSFPTLGLLCLDGLAMTLKKTEPFSLFFSFASEHFPFSACQMRQNSLPWQVSSMCMS